MRKLIVIAVLISMLIMPQSASANMAAPKEADIGSSVTFEKNEDIAVISEVLDITVKGIEAEIKAVYNMKNTTDKPVSTPAMFLSPNITDSDMKVLVNGNAIVFDNESYALSYDTEVQNEDWQYAVLNGHDDNIDDRSVESISFNLDFAANEEYEVEISYTYLLGGYPDYDFDAKDGIIEYYLAPAAMWKDFQNLTINLHLDEDMPVIASSNLAFQKLGEREYQYFSDTLPEENLRIVIDENWFQNILSTLRSPYLGMNLLTLAPFILLIAAILISIIWQIRKARRN